MAKKTKKSSKQNGCSEHPLRPKPLDDKNKVSFQIAADGTGIYKDENNDTTITIGKNNSTYTQGNITIENNGDGSGTYNDKDKDLLIKNDGKGKAIITLKGKTTEVEAKPLEKNEKGQILADYIRLRFEAVKE